MVMHTDIPTHAQIDDLLATRAPACVSIYLPTSRVTRDTGQDRIELKNLASTAIEQLRDRAAAPDDVEAIQEQLAGLVDDGYFWIRQADSLAVFATPDRIRTYRLPNRLQATVEVSDRFHVKPLLRAVTFPQAAWIVAFARGGVRVLEVGPDGPPEEVDVPELPTDAWTDQPGDKRDRVRAAVFARRIDHALQGVVHASDLPVILAATDEMAAIYRQVQTLPQLVATTLLGNPERTSDADLADAARGVLDDLYAEQLDALRGEFDRRWSQGRVATELGDIARLATMGAVDTVVVDIDADVAGVVDDTSGAVTLDSGDATTYGVADEIARRVHLAGGRVMAVRAEDVPGDGPVAALLRYAP